MTEIPELADAAGRVAELALAFGRIDRACATHPDGTPESDSDHTVMLAWLAPALVPVVAPWLDAGLVAQFAPVHDAVEVFAGDTPTLRIDAAGRKAKAAREEQARQRWHAELDGTLGWLPAMISRYEAQQEPEARFTRAVDKCCPTLVHLACGCADLRAHGFSAAELKGIFARDRPMIAAYAGDFPRLLELWDELAARVVAVLEDLEARANEGEAGS